MGLGEWCTEDELPEETRCKVEGLKTMARWLLGLKQDVASAQKTFRMLNAFITHNGEFIIFNMEELMIPELVTLFKSSFH